MNPSVKTPLRASEHAAAWDVYANIEEPILLHPGERVAVGTGLKVEIPPGYLLSVRPRSGLAIRHGLTMVNSPGTIDADYRGEIKILLINHGPDAVEIHNEQRTGQLILEKVHEIIWQEIQESELTKTQRSGGGFGSTGGI